MHTACPEVMAEMQRLVERNLELEAVVEALNDRAAQSRDSIVQLRNKLNELKETRDRLRDEVMDLRLQLDQAVREGNIRANAHLDGVHEAYRTVLEVLLAE